MMYNKMRVSIILQSVIIAICSIIPLSCSQPKANLSEVETVYVTNQHWPKTFHANSECKGLDNYTGDLHFADLGNLLITEYQPCGYCFNVTKLPTIRPKDPEWKIIEQDKYMQASFSNDIKFCDGLYFLRLHVEILNSDKTFSTCYIFDRTLTKYGVKEGSVEDAFLEGAPSLIPIIDYSYAVEGVKFIRDQLSWRKAIMDAISEWKYYD